MATPVASVAPQTPSDLNGAEPDWVLEPREEMALAQNMLESPLPPQQGPPKRPSSLAIPKRRVMIPLTLGNGRFGALVRTRAVEAPTTATAPPPTPEPAEDNEVGEVDDNEFGSNGNVSGSTSDAASTATPVSRTGLDEMAPPRRHPRSRNVCVFLTLFIAALYCTGMGGLLGHAYYRNMCLDKAAHFAERSR